MGSRRTDGLTGRELALIRDEVERLGADFDVLHDSGTTFVVITVGDREITLTREAGAVVTFELARHSDVGATHRDVRRALRAIADDLGEAAHSAAPVLLNGAAHG